jgi:trimeric autotransporter adhesin
MHRFIAAITVGLVTLPVALTQSSYPYAINTLAGTYVLGNGGPATAALIDFPLAVTVDGAGNVYVADGNGHGIRKITPDGTISLLAPNNFVDIKTDSSGNLYATDGVATIYKITPSGTVTPIAGGSVGFGGDGSVATSARFDGPSGVALDGLSNIYVADTYNNRVREINLSTGQIQTVAGNGGLGYKGDNGQATSAQLALPTSVAVDSAGNIYIAEYSDTTDAAGNLYVADPIYSLVRVINSQGAIRTIAGVAVGGEPTYGYTGDGGPAVSAELFSPSSVGRDANGFTYIADEGNQRIRRVDQNGVISTIAGASHFGGDGGPAVNALMDLPEAAVTDANGNIFFSDTFNNRVRRIGTNGVITTVAGTGACGYTVSFR